MILQEIRASSEGKAAFRKGGFPSRRRAACGEPRIPKQPGSRARTWGRSSRPNSPPWCRPNDSRSSTVVPVIPSEKWLQLFPPTRGSLASQDTRAHTPHLLRQSHSSETTTGGVSRTAGSCSSQTMSTESQLASVNYNSQKTTGCRKLVVAIGPLPGDTGSDVTRTLNYKIRDAVQDDGQTQVRTKGGGVRNVNLLTPWSCPSVRMPACGIDCYSVSEVLIMACHYAQVYITTSGVQQLSM